MYSCTVYLIGFRYVYFSAFGYRFLLSKKDLMISIEKRWFILRYSELSDNCTYFETRV